jgi:hypothetical protein
MFTTCFTPRGKQSLLFRRMDSKKTISTPGDNFTPRGEVKNVPHRPVLNQNSVPDLLSPSYAMLAV